MIAENLRKHMNEHEENVVISMMTEKIKQVDFDIYVHELILINLRLIKYWSNINIENFKHLVYKLDSLFIITFKKDSSAFNKSLKSLAKGQQVVLICTDIKSFYPSIDRARLIRMLRNESKRSFEPAT